MNDLPPTAQSLSHKDRSAGLVAFGIITALLGGVCALFIPLIMLGSMAANATESAVPLQSLLPSVFFYGVLAIVLISLGIGSVKARRWARALLLVFSWSWLVIGIISVFALAFLMPGILDASAPAGEPALPEDAKTFVLLVAMASFGVIFVALPAVWVFFYRSPHVKATCEARDPVRRWTDACPLPVLAVSLWLAMSVPMMLMIPLAMPAVLPFFGDFITGSPAAAGFIILAVIWAWSAWAIYRLDGRAWWVLLLTIAVFMTSHVLTYLRQDPMELYQLMGYSDNQLEQIKPISAAMNQWMIWGVVVFGAPFLAYMIYIRKFFRPAPATGL